MAELKDKKRQIEDPPILDTSCDNRLPNFQSHHNSGDFSRHDTKITQIPQEELDDPFISSNSCNPNLAIYSGMQDLDGLFDFEIQPELTSVLQSPINPNIGSVAEHSPPSRGTFRSSEKGSRERNCIAARKCRTKAKQRMTELQERERKESQRNRLLSDYIETLRGEVVELKNEILRHSQCDSEIIQNYIQRAAQDIS
ncbi:hypothetical protein F5B20DRAFT_447427 [Whalleya microplaca]|nr:hypothetical protein F5B20DRAFT_447427 [Whalleya microplaca]